jgi:glycine hydroxymethyltransferase
LIAVRLGIVNPFVDVQEQAMNQLAALAASDPAIGQAIRAETQRQSETLSLIASENHSYPEVLATSGSVLTDKYAEGYPGKRYYAGQRFYDEIESLAIERAKAVFRAEHANVQPLSGSPMNQAVYFGLLEPGDTILAMDLSHGGHLTHGAPVSHMGRIFRFVRYKTHGRSGDIDFDEVRRLARDHQPKLVLCGHSSYPRELDYGAFKAIADEVGALTMADVSHIGGLIAARVLRNPLDAGFDVLNTTTHKTLRGPRGGLIACTQGLARSIDKAVFPGLQGGPHMHQVAGIAVALHKAANGEFRAYAARVLVNARTLAEALARQSVPLVTGGTENHLLVLDVAQGFGLDGAEAQLRLEQAGLVTNKQLVPDDPRPPGRPSGLRLGTPAVTTRGMGEAEMADLADLVLAVLIDQVSDAAKRRVRNLADRFPIPGLQDVT